jgi:hypothetical protein
MTEKHGVLGQTAREGRKGEFGVIIAGKGGRECRY